MKTVVSCETEKAVWLESLGEFFSEGAGTARTATALGTTVTISGGSGALSGGTSGTGVGGGTGIACGAGLTRWTGFCGGAICGGAITGCAITGGAITGSTITSGSIAGSASTHWGTFSAAVKTHPGTAFFGAAHRGTFALGRLCRVGAKQFIFERGTVEPSND